jgi:lipopolysaccharide export system permease protein
MRLDRYIFRRAAFAFTLILCGLTGMVWATQALRRFDLVTAQGQTILTFLSVTLLILPYLMTIVAPFALVFAMVATLNTLHAESEFTAMAAAGATGRRIFRPFLALALLTSLLVAFVSFWAGPRSLQMLRDFTANVRADVVSSIIEPGQFTSLDENLTFHIRNRGGDGSLQGIFIRDSRDPALEYTYSAARGQVVEALGKTLILMQNGTIERTRPSDGAATFIAFGSYAFDLSELQPEADAPRYRPNELTIDELLAISPDDPRLVGEEGRTRVDLHARFTNWLYPIAMALAVFVYLGHAHSARQGRTLAIAGAIALACLIRIAGFAVENLAGSASGAIVILYALPLSLIAILSLAVVANLRPRLPSFAAAAIERLSDRMEARRAGKAS